MTQQILSNSNIEIRVRIKFSLDVPAQILIINFKIGLGNNLFDTLVSQK